MGAGQPRLGRMDAVAADERTGDGRAIGLVAVVADAHPYLVDEIDAVDCFEEAVDKMLPRLLAVADDVDPGILLELQREDRRVALGIGQRLAFRSPRRPQLFCLGEPGRLWQTAGDRRFEHGFPPRLSPPC
jgi:hypothetical protein